MRIGLRPLVEAEEGSLVSSMERTSLAPPFPPLLSTILPEVCHCVEVPGHTGDALLLAGEAVYVHKAVAKRKAEFASGRACARRALAKLGLPPRAILQGSNREPLWPVGVVGSITHCEGYAGVAVARKEVVRGIGVDAEIHKGLPSDVLKLVASESEFDHMAALPNSLCWDCLLFSAKEAFFKAWFPITRHWLDFNDVQITFLPERSAFVARVVTQQYAAPEIGPVCLEGRYTVRGNLLLTAVTWVPATADPQESD
jgi:4'-phosphopantetheinyl transferase EntD